MPKIVTFYNNKGGVSKTTTAFNLAAYLSLQGKATLLVDCDPQSNLTELFFASRDLAPDEPLPGTSIFEALRPRFQGDTGRIDVKSLKLSESTLYPRLSILRGDFGLGMAETYFAQGAAQAITENVNEKQTYLALHRLFNDLITERGFSHLIVDVGPSAGALSRMAVISSDAFFIPTTPDRFCCQAVSVLGKVMADWLKRHKQIIDTFEAFGLERFPGAPRLLGAVSQNFKAWGGKAKQSYKTWEDRIADEVERTFLNSSIVPADSLTKSTLYIAQIRDVGPLAPVAQIFGRAIFDVQQEHSSEASTTGHPYYGAVWGNWLERMNEYKTQIGRLAAAVE